MSAADFLAWARSMGFDPRAIPGEAVAFYNTMYERGVVLAPGQGVVQGPAALQDAALGGRAPAAAVPRAAGPPPAGAGARAPQ